jgi:hypothetical protein
MFWNVFGFTGRFAIFGNSAHVTQYNVLFFSPGTLSLITEHEILLAFLKQWAIYYY